MKLNEIKRLVGQEVTDSTIRDVVQELKRIGGRVVRMQFD